MNSLLDIIESGKQKQLTYFILSSNAQISNTMISDKVLVMLRYRKILSQNMISLNTQRLVFIYVV